MKTESGFFITGTDTNVGKTWASVALMRALQAQGKIVAGMKPVAAGCEWQQGRWTNRDALLMQCYSSIACDYDKLNPYAFEKAVSPHIACSSTRVSLDLILDAFRYLDERSEYVLVEGAGGWLSPLASGLDNAQLAQALRLPVILVVGMRLGCINHARLTYQAISGAGFAIFGWLAVCIERDMPELDANLAYLNDCLPIPFLGSLPHLLRSNFDLLAQRVNI